MILCTFIFGGAYASDLEDEQFIMDENEEENIPDEDEQQITSEDEHAGANSEHGAQTSHGMR